ncbi:MAG: hypothetical protein OJJ21_09485 [Ferrovibrio sp.]|nr:hypothetical protein [Ferrovibrio sp.]MCW0233816.1 hypothetical protein [Ferrovibrio sp.]
MQNQTIPARPEVLPEHVPAARPGLPPRPEQGGNPHAQRQQEQAQQQIQQ